jgi:hypothetical protein
MDDAYPGSTPLTSGHVSGNIGHITWRALISADAPDTVIAFFEAKLGPPDRDADSATWRRPADRPVDVLTVCTPEAPGPHRNGTPVPAWARTVIVVSQMARFG